MLLRVPRMIVAAASIGLLLLAGTASALAATPTCDGACLTGMLDQHAVPAPGSIEARLRRMEDEQAIVRLLLEYGRTLDARDFAAYSALFAAEGQWIGALGTFKGPAEIKTAMERIFAGATDIPKGSNFHVMSNFDITVQGDRALAKSMFVFYTMDGSKPEAEVAGRYEDVLVRIGGVWKFLTRTALPPG